MFLPTMEALLACAEERFTADGRLPGRRFIRPGGLPATWDDCCSDGGQLWVRLLAVFPSRNFPTPDSTAVCPDQLAARLAIGTIRCAHVIGDDLDPPTVAEMTEDAAKVTLDASALLCVLTECAALQTLGRPLIGSWTGLGPRGGCVGGEWTVTTALNVCGCETG